jgi:hypothetical protein
MKSGVGVQNFVKPKEINFKVDYIQQNYGCKWARVNPGLDRCGFSCQTNLHPYQNCEHAWIVVMQALTLQHDEQLRSN